VSDQVTGIILCGGRSRRFNGADKALLDFRGEPMVAHINAVLAQCSCTVLISANRNQQRYLAYAKVIEDDPAGGLGPLAGINACLTQCTTPYAVVCPGDSPGTTAELFRRLTDALMQSEAEVACAHDGERRQNLLLAVRSNLQPGLALHLAAGHRSVHGWLDVLQTIDVDCRDLAKTLFDIDSPGVLAAKNQQITMGERDS